MRHRHRGRRRKAGGAAALRPTSETLFLEHQKIIHSYRDLPKLYNQWCSVVRWGKDHLPFLRSSEFCGRKATPCTRPPEKAQEFTLTMLNEGL